MNEEKKLVSIFEYELIDSTQISDTDFESLWKSVLSDNGSGDPKNILTPMMKGGGRYIKANNYVGAISFRDGTTLEILPKIGRVGEQSKREEKVEESRRILERMLSTFFDIPFKTYDETSLNTIKQNPFEFFIKIFTERVDIILDDGLASAYYDMEGNEPTIRGRINFSQNLRYNHSHQERVYVEYQLFGNDMPANRLIKTTVELLSKYSRNQKNRSDLNRIRSEMDEVPVSKNVDADFDSVVMDRSMESYRIVLRLCDVFLRNTTLSTLNGGTIATSFLFPMDRLFEVFVANLVLKKYGREYNVKIQKGMYLFSASDRKFLMKPDIIVTSRHKNKTTYIIDTKWKLITSEKDISQADIYQMYVYSHRFETAKTILLYPGQNQSGWSYSVNEICIEACFIDLSQIDCFNLRLGDC